MAGKPVSVIIISSTFKLPSACLQVPRTVVRRVSSDQEKQKLDQYELRSYVEDSKRLTWCPAPNCQHAVECVKDISADEPLDVLCKCGSSFCFTCKEEAHRPVGAHGYAHTYTHTQCAWFTFSKNRLNSTMCLQRRCLFRCVKTKVKTCFLSTSYMATAGSRIDKTPCIVCIPWRLCAVCMVSVGLRIAVCFCQLRQALITCSQHSCSGST